MDYKQLSQLNKEFAELTAQMNDEFNELFQKWVEKNPRIAIVNGIHMPLNIVLNLIAQDKDNFLPEIMPDLPYVFMRFAYPFAKIKKNWGKKSGLQFVEEYGKEYVKLFADRFASDEERKNFEEWFKFDTNKHKQNPSS